MVVAFIDMKTTNGDVWKRRNENHVWPCPIENAHYRPKCLTFQIWSIVKAQYEGYRFESHWNIYMALKSINWLKSFRENVYIEK